MTMILNLRIPCFEARAHDRSGLTPKGCICGDSPPRDSPEQASHPRMTAFLAGKAPSGKKTYHRSMCKKEAELGLGPRS